jgi:transposase
VNQIYKWKKQLKLKQDKSFAGPGKAADQDAEIRRLNKELEAMREENEFLKKTAIFFAKHLPRVDVVHEIPESERHRPHDGKLLVEIDELIREQLDIIPAKIQVIRHIGKKYACSCGQCIQTVPLPAQPIPKSLASPGLLAHIAVSKCQDALPLYRQETILQRIGVELPRAALANWMIQAGRHG